MSTKFWGLNRLRTIYGAVLVGCCCNLALADFAESVDVNGKIEFVEALMKTLRTLPVDSDSFASYSRRGDNPLTDLVLIRTENKKTTVYVAVLHERSKDHGDKAGDMTFVLEFPLKSRVVNPVVKYQLDATQVAKLAKSPSSISMSCLCVREMETNKLTWATSILRISFDKDEQAKEFLESLSKLLFDNKLGKNEGYVSLSKDPY